MPPIDLLLGRLEGVRKTGPDKFMARCPAHNDQSPSLSIRETEDGKILLYCFPGCSAQDVLDAIGLTFEDLYPDDRWKAACQAATANGGRRFRKRLLPDNYRLDLAVERLNQGTAA